MHELCDVKRLSFVGYWLKFLYIVGEVQWSYDPSLSGNVHTPLNEI